MLITKTAAGHKNGHSHTHSNGSSNGYAVRAAKTKTIISRVASFKRVIVEQFRSKPFSLGQKEAERCALYFMKK